MVYRVGIFNQESGRLSGAVDFAICEDAEKFVQKFNNTGSTTLFPMLGPNKEIAKGPYNYTEIPTVKETEEIFKQFK